MRKIYTLATALILSIGSISAQTMFISIDGQEVKNGDNIVISKLPKETAIGPMTLYDLGVDVVFRTNIAQTVDTEGIDLNKETPGLACCPTGFSCTTANSTNNWTSTGSMTNLVAGREVNGEWIHYNYQKNKPAEGTSRESVITFKGQSETITFHLTIKVEEPNGIEGVKSDTTADSGCYNMTGQMVKENAKGIVIKQGKKFINK